MWLGIHYIPSGERGTGETGDLAIVHVYQRDRLFTVGGAPEQLAEMLTFLRAATYDSALAPPRCRTCGFGIDVPDIDELEAACGSA